MDDMFTQLLKTLQKSDYALGLFITFGSNYIK